MKKRIFLYSYTRLNLGDDLFVKICCDRYPEVKFFIICRKNLSFALKMIPNLVVISDFPLMTGILKRLVPNLSSIDFIQRLISSYCNGIVSIGGSVFIEPEEWEEKIKNDKKKMILNKPFYIIGSNFGPYKHKEYYEEYKALFKKATDVCFRDRYSYGLFADCPKTRLAADIVFSYDAPITKCQGKSIIISVIDLSNRKELKLYSEAYINKIIELSRYYLKKQYVVYVMGFCKEEGDDKSIAQVLSFFNEKERKCITPYIYSGDIDYALNLIQHSECIVATRFHAMILGWFFHKPVFPIVYSDKSLHVMKDIGFKGKYSKIENIHEVKVSEVFEYLSTSEPLDIEQQLYSANMQFKMLDEFLLKDKNG